MHGGGKNDPGRYLEGVRDVDVDGCVRFIKASTVGKHNSNSQERTSKVQPCLDRAC